MNVVVGKMADQQKIQQDLHEKQMAEMKLERDQAAARFEQLTKILQKQLENKPTPSVVVSQPQSQGPIPSITDIEMRDPAYFLRQQVWDRLRGANMQI